MCLDPLLGQGMSVAAWHASILAGVLVETNRQFSRADLTKAYLSRTAAACHTAWNLGEVPVKKRTRTEMQELGALLDSDPESHRRYVGAWHLIEPAAAIDAAFAAACA
jgi:hypothetical protein